MSVSADGITWKKVGSMTNLTYQGVISVTFPDETARFVKIHNLQSWQNDGTFQNVGLNEIEVFSPAWAEQNFLYSTDAQGNITTMVTDSSGQPAEMSTQTRIADGMKITVVSMAGTYASMASGMPVPQSGQGFRGAIIEAPRGNVFVRLSGPEAAVKDATPAWETMVYGARKQ